MFVGFAFGPLPLRISGTPMLRSLQFKPITYFGCISCFLDDDNINRLISTYLKKIFRQKIFKIKNLKQKLRDQVLEAKARKGEAEAIQKLALPHL